MIAVALYGKNMDGDILDKLLKPVYKSVGDKEQKVQLAACDALFNIVMTYKEAILRYNNFLRIFD